MARLQTVVLMATVSMSGQANAQAIFERTVALAPAEVDLVDATGATHLENARRFLAEKQWDEAVDAIRRAMEGDAARYINVAPASGSVPAGFERLVPLRDYCQWRIASLASEAPEALRHYRSLADPLAEQWLREASAARDERLLARLVKEAFATRYGDDALLRLGDMALERGEFAAARGWYERIGPALRLPDSAAQRFGAPAGSPAWLVLRRDSAEALAAEVSQAVGGSAARGFGQHADSDLPPAVVRSRLVLASLLEGAGARARLEWELFRRIHPDDEGELAGRSGKLADLLGALREQSTAWPPPRYSGQWPTLAGAPHRNGRAAAPIDPPARPAWSTPLPRLTSDRDWTAAGRLRVTDDMKGLLSYFPAVVGQTVLIAMDARGSSIVSAHDVRSGRRLWHVAASRDAEFGSASSGEDAPFETSDAHAGLPRHVGVARYTLTVHGRKLFVRMGSPITAPASRRIDRVLAAHQGYLAGFDLASEGKPLEGFPIRPESSEWSFEGTPLCDGANLYVAMRRIEQGRCQFYLACFELQTTGAAVREANDDDRPTGRMKWRTKVCAAGTLSGGDAEELSHLLLALDSGTLYFNTHHGVIAAIDASDGQARWICKYPRAPFQSGDPDRADEHFFRDVTPCLVAGDYVICAPADCDRLFALERATGALAWATPPGVASDAVHLLGAVDDWLVASGNYLYWFDLHTGRLLTQYPPRQTAGREHAAANPRGLGRGVLAGDLVFFPTRESILIFRIAPRPAGAGFAPEGAGEIPLVPRGASGGNLVIASGMLLIATGDRLFAFDAAPRQSEPPH
jgi:outer membrane protein assembly factor BamB